MKRLNQLRAEKHGVYLGPAAFGVPLLINQWKNHDVGVNVFGPDVASVIGGRQEAPKSTVKAKSRPR